MAKQQLSNKDKRGKIDELNQAFDIAMKNRDMGAANNIQKQIKELSSKPKLPPKYWNTPQTDENINETESPQVEPFGVPLPPDDQEEQKQRATEQVIKNEPEDPSAPGTDPQARASATPVPPPKSPKEEAVQEPEGGWASRVKKVFQRGKTSSTTEGDGAGKTGAGEATKEGIKDRATQAVKKAVANTIAKVLATNPVTLVIIGVGLVIAIILFIVGISYMGTLNSPGPSTSGGKPLIAVDVKKVTDANALQNLLKLSGDKTVADQAVNEAASAMKKNLLDTKESDQVKNNIALTKQVDTALGSLSILEGSKTTESAKTFLTDLAGVYNLIEGNIPAWTASAGPTRLPVAGTVTVFNNELHGFSFLYVNPDDPDNFAVDNHNVYIRSEDGKAKCDAVDIGVQTGEAIYPIFGGKVTDVSTDGDGSDGQKITITSNDGKYTALYAHIKSPTKSKGDTIVTTEPLGIAKTNNIQIEIYYTDSTGNNCLVTNHADMIDHGLASRRHQDWGGYLWDRIKTTFNLK